jgi:hypothetical protein
MSEEPEKTSPRAGKALASALRERAGNRALLMQRLNDPERRIAEVILNHIADVVDGIAEPRIDVPVIVKRQP